MKSKFKKTKLGHYLTKHVDFKQVLYNCLITLLVIVCVIPLQYSLGVLNVKDENIFLLFTIAIIIVLIQTKNIIYGIVSSFIFVLFFNLLNAEPVFTLDIADPTYYISFLIFIVVSIIVSALVNDLQRRNRQAVENGEKLQAMYELSSKMLDNHDRKFIFNYVVNFFNKNLNRSVSVIDIDGVSYGNIKVTPDIKKMWNFALEKNIVCGKNTFSFKDLNYLAFPIRSNENMHGVLFVELESDEDDINKSIVEFIHQNVLHLVVALDREHAIRQQQSAKLDVEKEKLKNALLRSLSHDLKTPLTSIKSGSDLMLSSYDKLDDESKKEIIADIYNEACDLNEFIANLLNMTKLNQDKSLVKKQKEAVDDILNEVEHKFSRKLDGRTLEIENNKEIVFVYADAILLEQVLSNLISNAIKHTKPETTIKVSYQKVEDGINFYVIDNGGGIKAKYIDRIFEDFYTLAEKQDRGRGTGLGLSICKAIVEAHGGDIQAYNNEEGGATFTFNIPDKKEDIANEQ